MKTLLILGIAAMLLMSMSLILAEEDISDYATADLSNVSEGTLISPNTMENTTLDQETTDEINDELNETIGAGTVFRERLKLWFTFNQEKKAEQELKLARLELIRAKIAAQNNNTRAMEKALEAHERIIAKVQERINAIDGKATQKGIEDSVSKLVGLEKAVEVHEARIAKLGEILASENLTGEQIEIIQGRLEKAEENTAHLKEVQAAKIEKLSTRLMAISNMTEEEVASRVQDLKNEQNLSAIKALVQEVKTVRKENAIQLKEKIQNETTQLRERIREREANMTNEAEDELEQESEVEESESGQVQKGK